MFYEKRQKLADAQTALYNLEEQSAANIRSLNRQENRLRREEAARIAEAEKAIIADRAKYLESTLTYEESLLRAQYKSRKDIVNSDIADANFKLKQDRDRQKKGVEDRAATNLAIANSDKFNFEQRLAAVASREAMESQMVFKSEADRTKFQEENAKAREAISKAETQAKIANAQFAADSLAAISDLIGKDTAAGKALAIAAATVSTYLSAQKAYESQFKPLAIVDSPVRGAIAAGIAVAQGLANVKRIASVKIPGGGGGGVGAVPSGGGTMATPQFNVVGNSGINQLAGVLGNKEQTPVKAYVVPSDVTSGQSLDRNIIRNASLG